VQPNGFTLDGQSPGLMGKTNGAGIEMTGRESVQTQSASTDSNQLQAGSRKKQERSPATFLALRNTLRAIKSLRLCHQIEQDRSFRSNSRLKRRLVFRRPLR
jgi:hypothetical protein